MKRMLLGVIGVPVLLLVVVFGSRTTSEQLEETDMSGSTAKKYKYTNHLAGESSPYLLSHAHNPVDWYPWGEEALNKAKELDRPIFLSIGYASCHWCHVMERESFEKEEVAKILNDNYICIKVDREQRPDLDHIYMAFTTAMTGSGGWPMSVFLTPGLKPFFTGTYFPVKDSYGRPGFRKVITEIARAYSEEHDDIVSSADSICETVARYLNHQGGEVPLTRKPIDDAAAALMQGFDQTHGGFGQQPKFPHAPELSLFLRYARQSGDLSYLQSAEKALTGMANGGIRDHLGGGFARYSVDSRWLVPHFEKMLYDNAMLVPTYAEAYQITRNPLYLDVVRTTLDFILNEMTDNSGGFYSALDADSEGEEGKFYVWSADEIRNLLGDDADVFMQYYNVTDGGNFEGKNILHLDQNSLRVKQQHSEREFDQLLTRTREKLLAARAKRVRPLTDDKILTSWNGLTVSALCKGYQITGDHRYLDAAVNNARFVCRHLYRNGRLTHAFRDGVHSNGQFLEDYAYYIHGLLDLFESDTSEHNMEWLALAQSLTDTAIALFFDTDGTFYLREADQSDLIVRPKEEADGAQPAPGPIMTANLLKLNRLTGENKYLETGEKALRAVSGELSRHPQSMTSALFALDYYLSDKLEIVLVGNGPGRDSILHDLYLRFLPNRVIAVNADGDTKLPLFEGRHTTDGNVNAYICVNSTCHLPASTLEDFRTRMSEVP